GAIILTVMLAALAMIAGALCPRKELAFVSWNGMELMDVSTGMTVHPARNSGNYGRPAWSPDGRQLAFESTFGGRRPETVVMHAGGSDLRVSSSNQTDRHAPVWSPDGRQVAYTASASFDNLNSDIYLADLASSQVRNLTQNAANDYSPRW